MVIVWWPRCSCSPPPSGSCGALVMLLSLSNIVIWFGTTRFQPAQMRGME
jgi:hypothetical protein